MDVIDGFKEINELKREEDEKINGEKRKINREMFNNLVREIYIDEDLSIYNKGEIKEIEAEYEMTGCYDDEEGKERLEDIFHNGYVNEEDPYYIFDERNNVNSLTEDEAQREMKRIMIYVDFDEYEDEPEIYEIINGIYNEWRI